nr:target of Nesh-SH3 [Anolis sagrei ordinatus]
MELSLASAFNDLNVLAISSSLQSSLRMALPSLFQEQFCCLCDRENGSLCCSCITLYDTPQHLELCKFGFESMMSRLVFLLFCGNIALLLGNAQKLPRVKRQSLKVQINVTSDGVCMRYIRPSTSTKLEGFILGYGSSFFSNQYISLPADGKSYMTEVDAEPRYLISVRPIPVANYKKSCSGKTHTPKPLQLVIGTLTPTSVFLSWGILVNPKHDWTTMNNCANDRFYTVRYREKDKNKKWALQLCPTTETVVDNLKPNAVYEFGVKDNTDNGIWSKIFNHKVVMPSKNKENGQPQNNYILHNIQTQFIPGNSKVLHPVTIIKQVLQNVTQRTKPKIPEKSPLAGPILVHLIVPDFNGTQQKLLSPFTLDVPEKPKKTPAKNETQEWPAESKTPEVQEISPQSQPAMAELDWESSKPTTPSVLKELESPSARTNSELEASKHSVTPMAELSPDILAPYKFPEFPKTKTPPTSPMSTETLASHEIESVSSESQTPVPKGTRTKQVFSKTQPALSRPRTSDETDIPDSKRAVTNEPTLESLTPKTAKPLDWPKSTLAPPETAFIPSKQKPSDTPEGKQVKPAPNLPPLKHSTPKTSKILEKTTATPGAPVETNVIPSIPKPSIRPKMPDIKYAEKEHQWETTTHKTFKPVEFPRTTKVPSKTKIPVSMSQILPHLEQPKIVPAVTRTLIPVPATTMVSGAFELPVTTIASYELSAIPSKTKEPDYTMPEVQDSKPDSAEADNFSFKVPTTTELPFIDSVMEPVTFSNELPIVAPKVKEHVYSPKTTITPHLPHTKPVLEPIVLETDPPKTEIEERPPVSTRPKTWFITDAPQTKPDMEPVTFRIEQPKSTLGKNILIMDAPKETSRVPARLKTSPSPSIMRTKPSPKGNRRVSSKPKVPPTKSSLKVPPTKSEITSFSPDPITIMVPHVPEKAKATLASTVEQFIPNKSKPSTKPRMVETKPAVHRTTSQPFVLKPTVSSEQIKTIMAPKETWFISSKPKTSGKLDGPPSKPVPDAIYPTFPGSINLHIHVFNGPKDGLASTKPHSGVTTESPHLKTAIHKVHDTTAKPKTTDKTRSRLVVNKTTPVPGRTRTPGGVAWNKLSRGDKLTDQDATKLLSTSSSIRSNSSIHSSVSRKKPDPVATPPDLPRPPLAPAKPTPVRRKPLPPNTVTGKPGRSGNILMPRAPPPSTPTSLIKPAGPTGHTKTSSHKKPPTAASSPDYSNPMFSSLPTTETDVAGTPRYTGDHVKYMKKEEDVPCSITDTLQHFPTEDGENIDTATTPPRKPPTNLTVVTVEGCPSFVILDWEKPQNETVTEYKVVSTENGSSDVRDTSIITTNQTHSTVENLKPNTSYAFQVIPSNPLGEGPSSESMPFKTESADPRVTEPISMGKDAIWTEIKFNSDTYSECKGKQYVKRTWYKKFVGVQLCNSLRYKIYLSDTLTGTFYNIGDQRGHGEDHCQFVDSYLDGRTGQQIPSDQLSTKDGFFRAVRQEPVHFGRIGAETHTNYVHWYECGTTIPGKW